VWHVARKADRVAGSGIEPLLADPEACGAVDHQELFVLLVVDV
jgi:hypothetical protein